MNKRIKNKIYSYISFVQISVFVTALCSSTQQMAWAATCDRTATPTPTYSPDPTTSATPLSMLDNVGKCDTICSTQSSDSSDTSDTTLAALLLSACGSSPSSGVTGSSFTSNSVYYSSYSDCETSIRKTFGQVESYCKAIKLTDDSWKFSAAAAAAYTAAAIACVAACGLTWAEGTPFAGAAKAASIACTVAGTAGTVADISGMIYVGAKGGKAVSEGVEDGGFDDWWNTQLGTGVTSSILGAGGSVSAGIGTKLLQSNGAGSTQKAATRSASSSAIASCVAGGIFVATAALKYGNLTVSQKTANQNCCTVEDMQGIGEYAAILSTLASKTDPYSAPSGNGGGSASSSSGSTGASALSPTDLKKMTAGNETSFPAGMLSAATAGPMTGLFEELPNRDQIPDFLQQHAGTDLKDIAKRLASGQSPASILNSALPGLPDNLQNAVKAAEDKALNGGLGMKGFESANSTMTGGGGSAKSSGDSPASRLSLLSSRGGSGDFGAKEMNFGAAKDKPSSTGDDTDIWHSGWNGSIFQIISNKLSKNQNRIEQLEWSTPLNRALMGITNKPHNKSPQSGIKGTGK